jgi:predicted ATPase/DNA-binding SARP family transcriptional activator
VENVSRLALFLLGPLRVERDGEPVHIPRRKALALLAYLAVTGRRHSRDSLATLLWPELDQSTSRTRLRRALAALKKNLGDGWLDADRDTVGQDPDAKIWLDVDAFRDRLAACETHDHPPTEACPNCLLFLEEAVALYRDHFLSGFTLRDSPGFDEFQFFQTEGLKDQLAGALARLVRYHGDQEQYEPAIGYARRWLALDPLDEAAHRHLMTLYAQSGQQSAALRQYRLCIRALAEEMGVAPAEETARLYEQIQAGEMAPPAPDVPKHNLPVQTTPFVGRETELARLARLLADRDVRLLTILGAGGMGKTRLALEMGAAQLDNFEHGAFFVSLAPLRSVDAIVPTVAEALGFSFYAGGEPRQQLLDYLRQKSMLIIMDNFEHLLDGVGLVTDVLKTTPDVKILTTSRARLNVGGEHRFRVGGMRFPESPLEAATDASQYSAVELFLQGARRAQPSFELTDENLSGVVRVCRLVEGMPLGILLAAAWVEMLSPQEIADEISQGIDFLETDLRDVPARHWSMRATFDHSWNLLAEREREVFQGLSVFRGGFTREAAQTVAGAGLRELRALVSKSLLHRTSVGRYEVHELLRQYAEERLDQDLTASWTAHDRHCAHYVAALQRWCEELEGPWQMAAIAEMDAEIGNARAAWDWAVEQGQVERLDQATEGLHEFYMWQWRIQEGEAAFRAATSRLASAEKLTAAASGAGLVLSDKDSVLALMVLAKILAKQAEQSGISRSLGRAELADQLLRRSLAILERPELAGQDTRVEKAYVLRWMGRTTSDLKEARRLSEQSLALYRALGDQRGRAKALQGLGNIAWRQGLLEEAQHLVRESIADFQEIGDRVGVANGLFDLGAVLLFLGKSAEAHSALEESITIYKNLGVRSSLAQANTRLGFAQAHLGQYEQARAQGQTGLALAREINYRWTIGTALNLLGVVALAEEAYGEAQRLLEESIGLFREIGRQAELGDAVATQGYVARGLGDMPRVEQHLYEALRTATEIRSYTPRVFALPAVALLLADRSETERAVELYALASRYPLVANSRWFEDVAGRHITAITETLPPEVVAAARERGRARDLDATVAELLVELEGKSTSDVGVHGDERADE